MDFSSSAAFARTVEIADTKIVRVAASATKVLDALESLDRDDGLPPPYSTEEMR
jgi:hypothetical protein